MHIYNLLIETTKNCNLKCSHCLRGPARKEKLDINKLQSFLRSVDSISTITIGGGEPSLSLDVLEDLKYAIINSRTSVNNIYLVTNGLYKTKELAEWFYDFNDCICEDPDLSGFTFSFDHWHNEAVYDRQTDYRRKHYYQTKHFFEMRGLDDIVREHSSEKWTYINLIKMGRAINIGHRELNPTLLSIENEAIDDGEIYFTTNGEIYSSCDLSYKEMNTKSNFYICNYKENLSNKVKRYNKNIHKLTSNEKV